MSMHRNIRCIVAALNSNGEPDFHFVIIRATEEEVADGRHYDVAKEHANAEGYEALLAYDESDAGGRAIVDRFAWDTASVVLCRSGVVVNNSIPVEEPDSTIISEDQEAVTGVVVLGRGI